LVSWKIDAKDTDCIADIKANRFPILEPQPVLVESELPFFSAYETDVRACSKVIARSGLKAFAIRSRKFHVSDIEELKRVDTEIRRVSAEIVLPITRPYDYQAIGRKLCMVEELPQGAMQTYER
jgi:hypothetical protein